jgi:hypothetical protein
MPAELDHVFVCVSPGGDEESSALSAFGLSEGTPNAHPGQGTQCRRFFFRNGYLELLWVSNPSEASSPGIRPIHLWERWTGRGHTACPFGVGFRPGTEGTNQAPFPAWEYRPPYLPDSCNFLVGTNAAVVTEPMLFHLPFARRRDSDVGRTPQVVEHAAGLREITRITVVRSQAFSLSPAFEAVIRAGLVGVQPGDGHGLEIGFDGELKGQAKDFRPTLPLVFRW